jgi:hypothetical protein
MKLSISDTQHTSIVCHDAEGGALKNTILSAVMLNVIVLNVVTLSVVAP